MVRSSGVLGTALEEVSCVGREVDGRIRAARSRDANGFNGADPLIGDRVTGVREKGIGLSLEQWGFEESTGAGRVEIRERDLHRRRAGDRGWSG